MVDEARLRWALLVSVLLHALVLMSASALRNVQLTMPRPPSIDVDLAQLPPPAPKPPPQARPKPEAAPQPQPPPMLMPKQQIVTPPDAGEEKPPPDTSFLSDRDNVVEQQTVRRGEGPVPKAEAPEAEAKADEPKAEEPKAEEPKAEAPKAKQEARELPKEKPAAAPRPAAKPREQTKVAALPKLDKLFPLPGEFAGSAPTPAAVVPAPREAARRNLLPGSRQGFAVSPGVSDFLPTIREGDITLLNTKAEKFAPFVRRVAARVFQHLEINLKRLARSIGNGGSGREYAAVEAIMSKKGELISAKLVERETNTQIAVYKQLLGAARPDVFFDANPPAGAEAADGNIHFLLLVDLMIQVGPDPRGGASTGYYGMASVGLDAVKNAH
jgi:hypothetical protein